MSSHMSPEVKIQRELFPTNLTSIMSLFSMNQSMSLKFRLVQEFFVTSIDLTNVLFLPMNNQMFLKFINISKDFSTTLKLARIALFFC